MKNKFKLSAIILCSMMFMANSRVLAQAQDNQNHNVIEVTASARESVTPNKIEVRVIISQNPVSGNKPLSIDMDQMQRELTQAVKSVGLDPAKDLTLVSQSSNAGKKNAAMGMKIYNVTLTSAEQTSELFSKLTEAGITQARVTNITHTQMQEINRKVKAQAIINAQQTAQVVAEAIGQKAGKAVWIDVMNDTYYSPMPFPMFMAKGVAADNSESAQSEPIQFKDIEVTQSVTAKFELM